MKIGIYYLIPSRINSFLFINFPLPITCLNVTYLIFLIVALYCQDLFKLFLCLLKYSYYIHVIIDATSLATVWRLFKLKAVIPNNQWTVWNARTIFKYKHLLLLFKLQHPRFYLTIAMYSNDLNIESRVLWKKYTRERFDRKSRKEFSARNSGRRTVSIHLMRSTGFLLKYDVLIVCRNVPEI